MTEWCDKLLEDAGAQQKPLHLLRLLSKHHLSQIVQDIALAPAALVQQGERVGPLWERKAEQLQTYEPPFGASRHLLDSLIRELDPHHFLEEGPGLLCCTTQLLRTHFLHLMAGSLEGEWQGRIGSRREDKWPVRREMRRQEGEGRCQ